MNIRDLPSGSYTPVGQQPLNIKNLPQGSYQPASPTPQGDGFFTGMAKDISRPFARLGVNVFKAGQMAAGQHVDPAAPVNLPFLGPTTAVGQQGSFGRKIADTIGVGADLASTLIPAGKVATLAKTTLKGAIVQGVKAGAITGGVSGTLAGGGRELQNADATATSVAAQTGLGGITGAITGGVFGGALAVPAAGINKLRSNPTKLVDQRVAELKKVEDSNAPVRKIINKAASRGIDVKHLLAQTDLLHGAVDNTGTIRTQKAMHELNDFIAPHEKVISQNLEKEGVKIPLKDVEERLKQAIDSSGLEADHLEAGHGKLAATMKGLERRADEDGNILIAKIHDAKVSKYANIDYLNPGAKTADKAIARTFKELVQEHTKSVDVKALNDELTQHFMVLNLLEKLDGKKVEGGRLGKYFARTIGSIVGSHFGPLGAIAGAELGGRIKGRSMSRAFGGKVGKKLEMSEAMQRASNQSSNIDGSLNQHQTATAIPVSTKTILQRIRDKKRNLKSPGGYIKNPFYTEGTKAPTGAQSPEAFTIAKNMDQSDIKLVRNALDLHDGKIKSGGSTDFNISTRVDTLLNRMGVSLDGSDRTRFLRDLSKHFNRIQDTTPLKMPKTISPNKPPSRRK